MSADDPSDLVPRFPSQGYTKDQVDARRAWVEQRTGCALHHVGAYSMPSEAMRGNVENPIGAAQVPLGVAGPLQVNGEHARGVYYVPLATTEGALVRSYERGMLAITRAGGAAARVWASENQISPIFTCSDVPTAHELARDLATHFGQLKLAAESTTRHGKLLRIECHPLGRDVIVDFHYSTADAHGMNMIARATESACEWIVKHLPVQRYHIMSGASSEKRSGGKLMLGGKGKFVSADVKLPRQLVRRYLNVLPRQVCDMWHRTVVGHLQAHVTGYNGHYANGLTALFIACGQDVANVVNSAVGITSFEVSEDGDLYASVALPALTLATVGGGTALGTARECLEMVGCFGEGGALRLAELTAATLLAGELSMGAALASGEFVAAHEAYGRNRPPAADP
jgi:hydroxymethylglutaryl-CoA reductase (NADPH)